MGTEQAGNVLGTVFSREVTQEFVPGSVYTSSLSWEANRLGKTLLTMSPDA